TSVPMPQCTSTLSCRTSIGMNATGDWKKPRNCSARFAVDVNANNYRIRLHAEADNKMLFYRGDYSRTNVIHNIHWTSATVTGYAHKYRAGRRQRFEDLSVCNRFTRTSERRRCRHRPRADGLSPAGGHAGASEPCNQKQHFRPNVPARCHS